MIFLYTSVLECLSTLLSRIAPRPTLHPPKFFHQKTQIGCDCCDFCYFPWPGGSRGGAPNPGNQQNSGTDIPVNPSDSLKYRSIHPRRYHQSHHISHSPTVQAAYEDMHRSVHLWHFRGYPARAWPPSVSGN